MSLGFEIHVDTSGAEEKLRRAQSAFDRTAYLKVVGQRFLAWINENFRAAGAETPWKPLAPSTLAARRGGGGQPLRDTGRMAQSFVSEIGDDFVTVGTADQKAAWHHFGTRATEITTKPSGRPSRKGKRPGALLFKTPQGLVFRRKVMHPGIPARPLLPTKMLAEQLAQETLQAFVEQAIGPA